MKIKTNIRAGSGGTSGVGGNSVGSHSSTSTPIVFLYNFVDPAFAAAAVPFSRCAGV
jgi:hypothetical protein